MAKIEELLPHIEKYEEAEQDLTTLNQRFPAMLKRSILQDAIQGKLVSQNANDTPISTLIASIRKEKETLVTSKKIKADKKTSFIFRDDEGHYQETIDKETHCIDDELPFNIPISWQWIRLRDVCIPTGNMIPQNDFFYIDTDAVNNKTNVITPKRTKKENAPSRARRCLKEGDTLFSLVRPYLKNIAYIDTQFSDCIASTGFYICRPTSLLSPTFLFHLMRSDYVVYGLDSFRKGDKAPSINIPQIETFLIPLPPLEEQNRIVEKIETLLNSIENLTH